MNETWVTYVGGLDKYDVLINGSTYIVDGNKIYSHSKNIMITVTAEEVIKYFKLY